MNFTENDIWPREWLEIYQSLLDNIKHSHLKDHPHQQRIIHCYSVNLNFFPPTIRYLKSHLYTWSLSEVNGILAELSLPYVSLLKCFKKQPYVFEHQHLDTIAQFRLSNAGLGNRSPRWAGFFHQRLTQCPLCTSAVSEDHVILSCPSTESERKSLGITFYRNRCQDKGWSEEETFSALVNGSDSNGETPTRPDIVRVGLALDTLRGLWLAKWWNCE